MHQQFDLFIQQKLLSLCKGTMQIVNEHKGTFCPQRIYTLAKGHKVIKLAQKQLQLQSYKTSGRKEYGEMSL